MSLGILLDQIRDYYVGRLINSIDESAPAGATVTHEAPYCDSNGNLVTEGQLNLPSRGDLFINRDGTVVDSIQVDTEGMLSFEPVVFQWPESELAVELRPFQWNWLQIRAFGLPARVDWAPLRVWFIRWFSGGDWSEGVLLECVHFMSDPQDGDGYSQFSIDLGSAPIESFEGLLDAIARMQAN